MNVVKRHRMNAHVTAIELGYGLVGRPLMTVFCYLVDGMLIDTGQSRMAKAMRAFIDAHPIDRILLTHHHEDHSGNAALISVARGIEVYGHPLTVQKMKRIGRILPYQHLVWGPSRKTRVKALPKTIDSGRFRFVPIHTPGHSKDHVVYLEPDMGWLFSGDLYLGDRIKFFRSDENITTQIQSLKKVLAYEFKDLCCGHRPTMTVGKDRIRSKLAFLESFQGEVGQMVRQGLPEREIIRRLDRKQDRMVRWVTMGNASFANMVRAAIRAT